MPTPPAVLHRHATALNLGDEALCAAIHALLAEASVTIKDMVNEPHDHPASTGHIPDRLLALADFSRLLATLRQTDAVICGGGDLILGYPTSYLLLRAARFLGVPVYMVGVGVNLRGSGWLARRWQRSELPACERFWVRDAASLERLRELGVPEAKLVAVPDLVFTFERGALLEQAAAEPDHAAVQAQLPDRPYVAVSIREPEGNSAQWGEATYAALAEALDQLVERQGLHVVFVPMLSEARDAMRRHSPRTRDDEQVARRIREKMRHAAQATVFGGPHGFRQIFAVLAGARLTIGARLHSLIFSAVAQTPFVALSYNLKTDAFMRDAGLERFALAIDRLAPAELVQRAKLALGEGDVLRGQLAALAAARREQARAYGTLGAALHPKRQTARSLGVLAAWASWSYFRAVLALGRKA